MPRATVVIGLWHADRGSPVLSALRSEGTDEHLVLSIGELAVFVRALLVRGSIGISAESAPGPPVAPLAAGSD